MLIKQVHQKNVIFVTIGILKILVLRISHGFAMAVMILFMLKEVLTEFTFGHIPK